MRFGMVSGKQARKDHKRSSKNPILGSKRNHGVTKQTSNSRLKRMLKRMNAHDSLLMKSFIRGEVRDEVERKFQELLVSREKINEVGKSGTRSLELRFINDDKLPISTFTKTNITPKNEPLQVALFDVRSKSIVNEGPLSSIKIQICPIQGKFESCDDEDWIQTEFNDNILHQRENKEPLLVGDRIVALKNGVASISKIIFTDNSAWVRSKKFRLGARAMKNGEIIKEGISQAFRVKHIRGEDDFKLYSYEMIGQPILLLFNVIYEVVGVTFDAQEFYLPDDLTLTPNQKNLIETVKQDAYQNIEKLKAIHEAVLNSISLEACIKSTQEKDLQHFDISIANFDGGMQNVQIIADPVPDINEMPQISYDALLDFFGGAESSTFVDLLNSDMEISNSEKPKALWCKIRAVVKWGISVRRVKRDV
ncbi:hypothetical protein RYX36_032497, partial [Vicia faba]